MSEHVISEADGLTAAWRDILALHWADLYARLGGRVVDYLDAARRKAALHQIEQDATTARYVNLCCALGPNFEDKPDNEWALAILADERLDDWVKLHQLVVKAAIVLGRRSGDGSQISAQFLRADAVLLDFHDAQRKGADSDALPLARVACDMDAVDIRVLETEWRRQYKLVDGAWQLVSLPVNVASVRIGPGKPAPGQISVLTHAPKQGDMARLQIRILTRSRCDQDHHPLVTFAGAHGLSQWRGHLALAVSWQVAALQPASGVPGMGVALIEETTPDTSLLRATSCGLCDDGVPTGPLQTYVWAYPADQYLLVMQHEACEETHWPRPQDSPSGIVPGASRCRFERDGLPIASSRWAKGLQESLLQDLYAGLDRVFSAWQNSTQDSMMKSGVALLTGQATLTWGWNEGPEGLAGPPFMRLSGEVDLNHQIDLELTGEIEVGVTRTRIRLFVNGESPMRHVLERNAAQPSLFEVLLGITARWQMKFQVEFDPVAVEDAALWRDAGPCTGSMCGEVGLRPRLSGGSGWQWYARMHTEPVMLPICIHDPVLGQTQKTVFLLPGVNVLDWSHG